MVRINPFRIIAFIVLCRVFVPGAALAQETQPGAACGPTEIFPNNRRANGYVTVEWGP